MSRVKFNVMQGAPVPFDPKSFSGKWSFKGSSFWLNHDDSERQMFDWEQKLKRAMRSLKNAKSRWQRDMLKKRIEHATAQIAAIKLSRE